MIFKFFKPSNLKSMTKKNMRVVSFLAIFNKLKIVMKLITMLLLFGTIQAFAAPGIPNDRIISSGDLQQKRVTGRISDARGNPLTGVNIMEKGTTNGVNSDQNGNYAITVASANSLLSFSFVGYATQEITVGTQDAINLTLAERLSALGEIVVVGYSTQRKVDITGSVTVIDAKAMASQPATNIGKQLQGRASGVTVYSSGDPTVASSIRIRGINTINDNGPLFVIDGISSRDQNLNNINPNDIESIQILKDASASSIYGAQASNGVIIITTKHGKAGSMQITYNGYYGLQKVNKWYDPLNAQEYMEYWQKAQKTAKILSNWGDGINTERTFEELYNDETLWSTDPNYTVSHAQFGSVANPSLPQYIIPNGFNGTPPVWTPTNRVTKIGDTDWFKEISRTAPMQSHQITASGGNEFANYNFGFNYLDQEGVILASFMKRYSFRANTEMKIKNHIKIGENFTFAYTDQRSLNRENLTMTYRCMPWIPVYDEGGEFAGSGADGGGYSWNPYAVQWRTLNDKNRGMRIFGNFFAEIDFLKYFDFKSSFGLSYGSGNGYYFRYPNPEHSEGSLATNLNEYMNWGLRWVFNNTLTFKYKLGKDHSFNVLAGTEAIADGIGRSLSGMRAEYPFYKDPNTWTLDNGSTSGMEVNSSNYNKFALFGIFGRLDYAFQDKYLLTGIVRRDGVSRFSKTNRYGVFPSLSVGWRISKESFMQSLAFITDMKLRAGYGITGNSEIPAAYNYAYTYGADSRNFNYDISGSNNGSAVGMKLTQYGNPDTKWEETRMANIGLDLVLFNSHLESTIDIYQKTTSGMLVPDAYSPLAGNSSAPYINLGNMKNTGFDFSLTYRGEKSDFRYDVTATLFAYKNKVVKLNQNDLTRFYGDGGYTIITMGKPISVFWGYEIEGIYKTKEELENHALQAGINNDEESIASDRWRSSIGSIKFKDQNGDGVITDDDQTVIGNPHPDFTYSLDFNLGYKNWDLNLFFFGTQGNDIYNFAKNPTDFNASICNKSQAIMTESWDPVRDANRDTKLGILNINNTSDSDYSNSYYVENGSFLRCKNLQLSYTFPQNLINKIRVDNLKVYGQVTNLFTITKYSGPNPDIGALNYGGGGDWEKGVDYASYPIARTMLLGVEVSF